VFHDQARPSLARLDDGVSLIWLPAGGADDGRVARSVRETAKLRERDELARLLYVGLTRARDRLILCGRLKAKGTVDKANGWLPWLAEAFDVRLAGTVREVIDDQGFAFRRFGPDPVRGDAAVTRTEAPVPSPGWIQHPAPAEPAAQAWASPTALAERNRGATPSPLAATGGLGRFRRGDLIHRLFQLLPDLPAANRAAAAARILAKERDLTPEQRLEMVAAALGVLEDPRFVEVFGPGSRPEAAIAGTAPELPAGLAISGRVDRMTVTPDRVLVVDFKTNRPAPDRVDNADPAYLTQMAVYVAVLRAIFPGRRVEAALVWTDGPKLMPVPENLIVERLNALRRAS
jgi:ATP-dependent helicase/nuclease subunit A